MPSQWGTTTHCQLSMDQNAWVLGWFISFFTLLNKLVCCVASTWLLVSETFTLHLLIHSQEDDIRAQQHSCRQKRLQIFSKEKLKQKKKSYTVFEKVHKLGRKKEKGYRQSWKNKSNQVLNWSKIIKKHVKIENAWGVWILYIVMLSLNFLIADILEITIKRHWIMKADGLN